MNLSAAIMLVRREEVFPLRVEYDPDNKYNNNPTKVFKTLDPSIKKGDLVIVQTNTRHGFTIVKVTEAKFAVDFNSTEEWGWCAGKFDVDAFKNVLTIEDSVKGKVAEAQENKMRAELIEAMGLGSVSFNDVQLRRLAPASVDGVDTTAGEAPEQPQAPPPITPPGA